MRYAYTIYNVMFRRIIEILFFLFLAATAAAMMGKNNLDWFLFLTRSAFEFFIACFKLISSHGGLLEHCVMKKTSETQNMHENF